MRFLANENFPGAAVAALEAAGHDVVWVRMTVPGATDPEVLARAAREERVLLTFDKDFGELARASALPQKWGTIPLTYGSRLPISLLWETGHDQTDHDPRILQAVS
jgi:predicted nuclease of predicted toxin-antitoxin system